MTTSAGYWDPSDRYDQWPGCRKCLHFRGLRCAAYPEGIPIMLLSGDVDHMVPRPEDRSIRFEPKIETRSAADELKGKGIKP